MFLVLAFLLAISWLIAVGAFHVASASIHVLIGLTVVAVILHLVRVRHYRALPKTLPRDAVK
ncbi:MAG TPA: hypothetical protein VHJ20_12305 [Polyangia bacterium]|nr:hypothetical protein [Polyangia bacterium]